VINLNFTSLGATSTPADSLISESTSIGSSMPGGGAVVISSQSPSTSGLLIKNVNNISQTINSNSNSSR
jgi:hypothetical protein